MTDTRLPDRWLLDRRIQRLTCGAYRSFFNALMWSVANRTDGVIEPEDLIAIPGFEPGAELELSAAGLLEPRPDDGWLIAEFAGTQTTRSEHEVLERARAREREKKARQRAKRAEEVDGPPVSSRGTVPGDSTGGQYPVTAQAGRQASPALPKEDDPPTEVTTSKQPAVVALPGTETGESPPKLRRRATRLPQGWLPPQEAITAMRERFPHVDLRVQYELFCNYWHAKSGQNATKLDWVATWRNWIIKAAAETPQLSHNGHQLSTVDAKAAGWLARKEPE